MTTKFNVTTYSASLVDNPPLALKFEQWVLTLTPERDREQGGTPEGALAWVYSHFPTQTKGSLYQTILIIDSNSQEIVATGTICDDDRGVGAKYEISQDAFLGFVLVKYEHRNKGIGQFLCNQIDLHIQQWLNANGQKEFLRIALFTGNPIAQKKFEGLGFQFEKNILVENRGERRLFTKRYVRTI